MSKLKLLLLGGIFTLVGIFNFSSAGNFQMTCTDENGCTPDALTLNAGDTLIGYSDTEEGCNITATAGYEFHFENYNCAQLWINEEGFYCDSRDNKIEGSLTLLDSETLYFGHYQCTGPNTLTISYSSSSNSGGSGSSIIPGGFSNFTPAVNGLHETVKQLIPLVIYLGIGILVVILGFIAIRWLVNWMSNGIKSKFSSKRS